MAAYPERHPNVEIRPMARSDIPVCAEIVGETEYWQERYGITAARAENLLRGALGRNEGLLVACDDDSPIGFAWYVMRGMFARSGFLRIIMVRASRRNENAGSALLQAVERAVGDDLFLLLPEFNDSAYRFYKRHGYAEVGRLPGYVVPDVTEVILWRHELA